MLRHALLLVCGVAALAAAEWTGHRGGPKKPRPPPPMMARPIGRVSVFYHCMCERAAANETDGAPPVDQDVARRAELEQYVRRQVEQHGHEHTSLEDMLGHFGLDCEQCAASHIGGGLRVPLMAPHPPHPQPPPPQGGDDDDSSSGSDEGRGRGKGNKSHKGHKGHRKPGPPPPPMMPKPTVTMNFGCMCNSSAPMPPPAKAPAKRMDDGGHKHSGEHRHDLEHLMEHLGLECDCAKIAVMGHIDMPIMAKPKGGRPPPPALLV